MSRSMHDKRNKTQSVFRGWDYSEIIEWMDEENKLYKKTKWQQIKYRFTKFKKEIKSAFAHLLFSNWEVIHDEEYNITQTKKAINHLSQYCWDMESQNKPLSEKYKRKVGGIRTYVKRLSEDNYTSISPLWEGLSKVEDDGTFLRYTSKFLENLWD